MMTSGLGDVLPARIPVKASTRRLFEFGLPAAGVSLLIGIALLALSPLWAHAVGYCLGCLVPFALVAGQRRAAQRVYADEGIVGGPRARMQSVVVLSLGLVVGGVHAWLFAWTVA